MEYYVEVLEAVEYERPTRLDRVKVRPMGRGKGKVALGYARGMACQDRAAADVDTLRQADGGYGDRAAVARAAFLQAARWGWKP